MSNFSEEDGEWEEWEKIDKQEDLCNIAGTWIVQEVTAMSK
mgnify:CR=1 FL=1